MATTSSTEQWTVYLTGHDPSQNSSSAYKPIPPELRTLDGSGTSLRAMPPNLIAPLAAYLEQFLEHRQALLNGKSPDVGVVPNIDIFVASPWEG